MCHANIEKRKKTNNGRNRTAWPRKIRTLGEKETNKYLGKLEADTIKQEMKEKTKKEYVRRTREILKKKLYSRNLIKEINIWEVPTCKILGANLEEDEGRTSTKGLENKKPNDDKALHPRDDIAHCMCQEKKEEKLSSIEDSIDASIRELEECIKKAKKY